MPRYAYKHDQHVVELDREVKDRDLPLACPKCGKAMKRTLAKIAPPTVMERVDSRRNIKQRQDHAERVRKRAKKFFVENEMHDLIGKHGLEDAKRFGWIKPDGKVITPEDAK